MGKIRLGIGFDVHRLVRDRKLILGGIAIPFEKGLLGHSDADVLLHAVCDGILGGLGEGDIGIHFPDSDIRYKDIASTELLTRIKPLLSKHHASIDWIDIIVMAQRPKIAGFVPSMKATIAQILEISEHHINIKATTTEGLGFIGREEGIAVHAAVTLNVEDHP
jgi:2-C-methyl-D-erythritol 2,4-cyclodiphosphate synthase